MEGLEPLKAKPDRGLLENHFSDVFLPVSFANEVACKGLDWLEAVFPMLLTTTEQVTCDTRFDSQQTARLLVSYLWPQVVATAKDKVAEIQDVASVAANGSADCVNMGVAWLMVRWEVAQDQAGRPLVDRAIAAAAAGVDSALAMSEAVVDRMLPPAEGLWIHARPEAMACVTPEVHPP